MGKTSPSLIERLRKRLARPGKLSGAWYWMRYHFSRDFFRLLKVVLKGYCVEIESGDLQYHCDVYVNTRNIGRFLDGKRLEWCLRHPHELYMIKARKLYFKIREERDPEWWD